MLRLNVHGHTSVVLKTNW